MSEVTHASFVIERRYDAHPARVFAAFSTQEAKAAWACHEDWRPAEFDFRPGGREVNSGGEPGGPVYTFDGRYCDIVQDERIVFAYAMSRDGVRISVSIASIEFRADGGGTRLLFAEHGAFMNAADALQREQGSGIGLDNLAALLAREAAAA